MEQGFPPKIERNFEALKSKLKLFATSVAVIFSGHVGAQNLPNTANEREPIIVNDPSDPKLQAYQDSLNLYKGGLEAKDYFFNKIEPLLKKGENNKASELWSGTNGYINVPHKYDKSWDNLKKLNKEAPCYKRLDSKVDSDFGVFQFAKPTQPVEYRDVNGNGPAATLSHGFTDTITPHGDSTNTITPHGERLKENINKLNSKNSQLIESKQNTLPELPVTKTEFNTDSKYTITSGIGEDNSTTYFPDEVLLAEAVSNLRDKYPNSVQSQKSKGKANYDFPGASGEEVMDFDKNNPSKQNPEASDSLAQKQ